LWWSHAFERGLHPHEALGEGGNRFLLVTIPSSQKRWVIIDIVGSHLSKNMKVVFGLAHGFGFGFRV
jgi:hypothetical protein